MNTRGIALYLVLTVLLIVIILTSAVLTLISSQSSLANHQLRRIQAKYAAQAGMNYALEQLRLSAAGWVPGAGTVTKCMCQSDPLCVNPPCANLPNIIEPSLPGSIRYVQITLGPDDATKGTPISVLVNYTANN